MDNITVKFIGKEYSIPEDILTYIELLDFTNSIQTQLKNSFLRKLRNELDKGNVGCLDDEIMAPDIEQQTGKFIAKLTDYGIFDRTINDYLCKNEGYKVISKVNASALTEAKRALNQQMSDWLQGYEDAVQKKDASVTGLGFSIWSGSFVNHAIYAAMEASKVNAQEKAAAKEYQRDMAELDARLESRKSEEEKRYIANTYIPHMEAAITVFAYELLDTYISDLIKNGKMDKDTLKYINIDRSNDLLKNLTLSSNKEEILYRAFEACPYNLQVYSRALNYGLLDYESYKTAEYFKQEKNIIFSLVSNLGDVEYPKKFKINYDVAEKMAEFTQSDVVTILQAKTKEYVSALIKAYQNAFELITNKEQCFKILRGLSESSLLAGEVISRGTAQAQVNSIVTVSTWNQLVDQCGCIDLIEKIKAFLPADVQLQTKSEIDNFLIEKITVNFEEARQSVLAKINIQKAEEEKRKIIEAKKQAEATETRKKNIKKAIIIGIVFAIILGITIIVINVVKKSIHYNEQLSIIESSYADGGYESAISAIITSDLDEAQKSSVFNDLINKTKLITMDIYGLKSYVPEQWEVSLSDDGDVANGNYPHGDEEGGLQWYIQYEGEYEDIHASGDDYWTDDSEYKLTNIDHCTKSYVRYDSGENNDGDTYKVIDYRVICDSSVFQIQYFAYEDRYYEKEAQFLLEQVDFAGYKYDDEVIVEYKNEVIEAKYNTAIKLMNQQQFEDAISAFEDIEEYKDSTVQIEKCKNRINEENYNRAITLINEGSYKEAITALEKLGDFKNAKDLIEKYKFLGCEKGDEIVFGTYEQDNDVDNGYENIHWIVLERKGNQAFIISKHCIEQKPFNETYSSVVWENCTLRKWLNNDFYNVAFSKEEQNRIISSKLSTDSRNTVDKVFLLSEHEAEKYFATDYDRKAYATEHVSTSHCYWLLRTTGSASNVAYVNYDGKVGYYENVDRNWWVRPAMWIKLSE